MIRIKVLFFASLRDELGVGECQLRLDAMGLEPLRQALAERLGDSAELLWADNVRMAKNQNLLSPDQLAAGLCLADGDEVAFLPPVTGG